MAKILEFPRAPSRFSTADLRLFGDVCDRYGPLLGWAEWRLSDYGDGAVIEALDENGWMVRTVLKDGRGRVHAYDGQQNAIAPERCLSDALAALGVPA